MEHLRLENVRKIKSMKRIHQVGGKMGKYSNPEAKETFFFYSVEGLDIQVGGGKAEAIHIKICFSEV